jgi:hypothetical protein
MSYTLIKSQRKKVNIEKGECRGVEVNLNNIAEVKMKKLALIVIIAALSTLMTAAVASADDKEFKHWGAINGTYEMMATGSCLHASKGFTQITMNGLPWYNPAGDVYAATTLMQATWEFKRDGTATFIGSNYATVFPGGDGPDGQLREFALAAGANIPPTAPLNFNYVVTKGGWITGTIVESGAILEGRISQDHKIITLGNANQIILPDVNDATKPFTTVMCNTGRILIKVND